MTPFIFLFFGHFHFFLLLWSDSSDEEFGSFSSSRCINECKTWTVFQGGILWCKKEILLEQLSSEKSVNPHVSSECCSERTWKSFLLPFWLQTLTYIVDDSVFNLFITNFLLLLIIKKWWVFFAKKGKSTLDFEGVKYFVRGGECGAWKKPWFHWIIPLLPVLLLWFPRCTLDAFCLQPFRNVISLAH